MPISSRKDSASILTVGWRETKPETGPEAISMMITAMMNAVTMIHRWSAMPTAVITESRMNTMTRMATWVTTATTEDFTLAQVCASHPYTKTVSLREGKNGDST